MEGVSAYNASKAALSILSKASAFELGVAGIRVNYVRPGLCKTTIMDDAKGSEEEQMKMLDAILARLCIKRLVEPSEVANAVIYLSSPLSSMVTGTSITMDGGYTLG